MDLNNYVELMGIYPGMYASKFFVRQDSWNHFLDNHLNYPDPGSCFLPCKDIEGDMLFVDMTKLLAFYVVKSTTENSENKKSSKKKKDGSSL